MSAPATTPPGEARAGRWVLGCWAAAVVATGALAWLERSRTRALAERNDEQALAIAGEDGPALLRRAQAAARERHAWAQAEQRWLDALVADREIVARDVRPERTAAFFELTRRSADLRQALQEAGVVFDPEESFGFSAYRVATPPAEITAGLVVQWRHVEGVIRALAAARPTSLIAVKREPVGTGREPGDAGRDWFNLDSALRPTAVPAGSFARAYRIDFTGETDCLRQFLQALLRTCPDARVVWIEAEQGAGAGEADPSLAESPVRQFRVTLLRLSVGDPTSGQTEGAA